MENYSRAYRDLKSPLTPLTPLSQNPTFKFDFGGDNSLDHVIRDYISPRTMPEKMADPKSKTKIITTTTKTTTITAERTTITETTTSKEVKPYSDYFRRLRDVFERDQRNTNLLNAKQTLKSTLDVIITSGKKIITPTSNKVKKCYASPFEMGTLTRTETLSPYELDTPTFHTAKLMKSSPKAPHPSPAYDTTPHMPKKTNSGSKFLRVSDCHLIRKSNKNEQKQQQKQRQKEQQRENYKKYFRQISPVPTKPLSPRVLDILRKTQLTEYIAVFQREEIDFEVLRLLSMKELQQLGITSVEDQKVILNAVKMDLENFYNSNECS